MKSDRSTRIRDKLDWITGLIEGRHVLYIGSVDDNPDHLRKHQILQAALQGHTAALLGVYRSDEQVAALRGVGLEAARADVEVLELGRAFETIVAVDNIEHLSNPGRFIQSMKRHLAEGGQLLLSTPNPNGLVRLLELLVYGRPKANVEHAGWYTGQVLDQLASRHGLRITAEVFIDEMHLYHRTDNPARKLGFGKKVATTAVVGLNRIVCPLFPQLSEAFGFVLEHD